MKIVSVGCAHPPYYYTQKNILDYLIQLWGSNKHEAQKLSRFHSNATVEGRYLALPIDQYPKLRHFGDMNNAFIEVAAAISEQAIHAALDKAGIGPEQVDIIYSTSVTGIAVPTIDARLIQRMGFREDVKRVPLFGLGCVAGTAGTALINDYLVGHPKQVAILLATELCSLTFQANDYSVPNLVATGLFGDGSAALVAVGDSHPLSDGARGPAVLASKSRFYPNSERIMGWDISEKGFKIVLSSGVPDVVNQYLRDDIDKFLTKHNLCLSDINSWVCHPGGPKVIDALIESMDLNEYDLALTRKTLREKGNMSSASVLFVLREVIETRRPSPGDKGLMLAMGPGFVSELVLLEW